MEVSFDPENPSPRERGLNLADANKVLAGRSLTAVDDRFAYGETRYLNYRWLDDRAVVMVWTPRDGGLRVNSMRHMHRWEIEHVGLD